MCRTKKHHFLPIFYLKNFTNKNNKFYIYLVKEDRFVKNGKEFSPSEYFFELYGNTMFYGEEEIDFIEHEFAKIDTEVALIINKIAPDRNWVLESREWQMLQYFVNIIYWRIPYNTSKVKEYIKNATSLSDFHLKVSYEDKSQIMTPEVKLEALNDLKSDPNFYKFLKLMLPGITFPEMFKSKVNDYAHVFPFAFADRMPKLISDSPIIYRSGGIESLHKDEFIFPITPTQMLFRHKFPKLLMKGEIRIYIDMILLMQADKYIACTDLNYPRILRALFKKEFNSIDELRRKIFDLISLFSE